MSIAKDVRKGCLQCNNTINCGGDQACVYKRQALKRIPLERTKTPAAHNQKVRLHTVHLMTDYFLGIPFFYPCFTTNLQAFQYIDLNFRILSCMFQMRLLNNAVPKDTRQYPNCMTSFNKKLQQMKPFGAVSIPQIFEILR